MSGFDNKYGIDEEPLTWTPNTKKKGRPVEPPFNLTKALEECGVAIDKRSVFIPAEETVVVPLQPVINAKQTADESASNNSKSTNQQEEMKMQNEEMVAEVTYEDELTEKQNKDMVIGAITLAALGAVSYGVFRYFTREKQVAPVIPAESVDEMLTTLPDVIENIARADEAYLIKIGAFS